MNEIIAETKLDVVSRMLTTAVEELELTPTLGLGPWGPTSATCSLTHAVVGVGAEGARLITKLDQRGVLGSADDLVSFGGLCHYAVAVVTRPACDGDLLACPGPVGRVLEIATAAERAMFLTCCKRVDEAADGELDVLAVCASVSSCLAGVAALVRDGLLRGRIADDVREPLVRAGRALDEAALALRTMVAARRRSATPAVVHLAWRRRRAWSRLGRRRTRRRAP